MKKLLRIIFVGAFGILLVLLTHCTKSEVNKTVGDPGALAPDTTTFHPADNRGNSGTGQAGVDTATMQPNREDTTVSPNTNTIEKTRPGNINSTPKKAE